MNPDACGAFVLSHDPLSLPFSRHPTRSQMKRIVVLAFIQYVVHVDGATIHVDGPDERQVEFGDGTTSFATLSGGEGFINSTVTVNAPNFVTMAGSSVSEMVSLIRENQATIVSQQAEIEALKQFVGMMPSPPKSPPPPPLPPAPPPPCAITGPFTFTGASDSYLNATSRTGVVGGGLGVTVCAWVYRSRYGNAWDRLFDFGTGATNANGVLMVYFGDYFGYSTGQLLRLDQHGTRQHFPQNTWSHVEIVQTRSSTTATTGPATIYWDGVQKATLSNLPFPPARSFRDMYIGKSRNPVDVLFTGQMRDLFIWDVALSASDISAVRLGSRLPASPQPLVSMMRSWCADVADST